MRPTRLAFIILLLFMLGGAGTWGAIADDSPRENDAKPSASKISKSERRASRPTPGSPGGARTNSDEANANGGKGEGGREGSGVRPDAEPTKVPDAKPEDDTNGGLRSKIKSGIGDAVDGAKPNDSETKPAKVTNTSPEAVTTAATPSATEPPANTSIRLMGGDLAGLDQTRQGNRPPGVRRLKKPTEGTVPPTTAEPLKGLFGEYYTLDKDPRNEVRSGRDPLLGETADYTRIDDQVYFPNRASFGGVAASDNVAVRWSGLLRVPTPGNYFLALGNDAAGALVIDGQMVVLNNVMWWYVETWAQVELSEGWHRIEIHHVEGPQGDDKSRNMACVFQWKPTWEEAARPVPSDWLGVPLELQAPEIEAVEPLLGVEVGGTITLTGKRFKQAQTLSLTTGEDGKVGMFVEDQTLAVYVDGLPAGDVKLVGDDTVTCVVPPGAGSGKVELRRGRVPSNQKDVTVTTTFGLVLSVWDLTGYPQTLDVPEGRAPDYVIHDEQPFPLTRAKFPQFDGKVILVRAEGQRVMEHVLPDFEVNVTAGGGDVIWELSVPVKITPQTTRVSCEWKFGDSFGSAVESTVGDSTSLTAQSSVSFAPMAWFPGDGSSTKWLAFETLVLFEHVEPASQSFDVSLASTIHGESRLSHHKPSIKLPPKPGISLDAKLSAPGSQLPSGVPSVRTGTELLVLADASAFSDEGTAVTFTVDDAPATFRLHDDATLVTVRDPEGRLRTRRKVWVTIPDDASHGVLRARRGIVQSSPIQIDIANRGLVGMYYDFNDVLREIPDMGGLTPLMRRIDKHLEFQNGTDFKLPFPAERFSSEWFGSLRVPVAGEYTFVIQSDDGVRLKLGGQSVVEFKGLRPPRTSVGKVTLTAGQHDLHLEFFENDVLENMVVWWIPPGKTEKEFIPLKYLSTDRHTPVPNKWPVGQVPVG